MATKKMILRFSPIVRVAHWMHTIAFFTLAITGYLLYGNALNWMAPMFGGYEGAQIVHRVAAVIYISATLLVLLVRPKELFAWLKEALTFTKNDIAFLKTAPYKLFAIKTKVPPQGYYNGGEKINSIIVVVSTIILTITGLMMWFPDSVSQGLLLWAYPMHALFFAINMTFIFVHIWLALLNPISNEAILGMLHGKVSEKYMEENHGQWYEEVYKAKKPMS